MQHNQVTDFDRRYEIFDVKTPRHAPMSGRYKQSFAYYTLRERLPVTLTSIVDNLNKEKDELAAQYGEQARDEIKVIIGQLSKLKYELQTDKHLDILEMEAEDAKVWNTFLKNLPDERNTFFKACWLYAECYMYRKVSSFFENSQSLKEYDHFGKQKRNALAISRDAMEMIAGLIRKLDGSSDSFTQLLKLNLWGNRCDLSITSGKEVKPMSNIKEVLNSCGTNLLINESEKVWECIANSAGKSKESIVSIVCDNAGYELYTDFVLADFIIDKRLASKVRFHVKAIPWFISDATPNDFHYTLKTLREMPSTLLSDLGKKWTQNLSEGKFELVQPVETFWTSPYEFFKMRDVDLDLYKKLAEAKLLIFKGDLNYRKLLGDYAWDYTEEFITCLRGFLPSNICTLRTIKADLICGLIEGQSDTLNKANPNWMVTGEYGVIQFCERGDCNCLLNSAEIEDINKNL